MGNTMVFAASRKPPSFSDAHAHRADAKLRLAAGFRLFAKLGLNSGVAGHITARDPLLPDHFWVNPFGVAYEAMRPDDLSLVRHDGTLVEGEPVNAAAFAIHSQVHLVRPDVACAAHGHPTFGTAWASLGRRLDPIGQDACAFYEDHVVFDVPTGLVVDVSEGARIARYLAHHKAAILRNHGLLTVGRTIDEALWWFVLMDRCCQMQLLAEAVGKPFQIPHADALGIARQVGTPDFGWFQCQPLLTGIVTALRAEA